jgi:hypothetical protein
MDMSRDPAKEGMDMDHSKMERDDINQSKWICPRICKEGMEMDHSKMEGMKMDDMQEEVVTADSAKDNMEGRNENGGNGSVFRIQL